MHSLHFLLAPTLASAAITFTINRASSPSADQSDAYEKINAAMSAAVARHAKFSDISKKLTVNYSPGTPTADANYNGNLNFGSNRAYMNERTALHEIAHALGIGQTSYFDTNCATDNWPNALALMRSWDGQAAGFSCGGGHFWPYGLNYDTEWSEENGDRHVRIIGQMIRDGLQGDNRELPSPVGGAGASSTEAVAAPPPETTSVLPTTTVEAVPSTTSEVVPEPTSEAPVTTPAPTAGPTAVPTKPSAGLPTRTRTRRRRPTRRPWWGPRVGGARTQA